jgi:phosphatidate phosphatase APP1
VDASELLGCRAMRAWQQSLVRAANHVEGGFDALRHRWHLSQGYKIPIRVLPFRGYGTPERIIVRGRVLRDRMVKPSSQRSGMWDQLVASAKHYATHEIGGATVAIEAFGTSEVATADAEGFLDFALPLIAPPPEPGLWHPVELRLLEPASRAGRWKATAEVMVPPASARFGVLSDIDDTVIRMGATQLVNRARALFLMSNEDRLPFEHVAGFYRALSRGLNPIFYVSSSPWNIYENLIELFEMHKIPRGPLFLRDWGFSEHGFAPDGTHTHKLVPLRRVLADYPSLPFVLIGDSGQKDPEIYEEIVASHPGRILTVYIRDVTPGSERDRQVRVIADRIRAQGVEVVLAEDTMTAARHAVSRGFIAEESLAEILKSD